MNESRDYMMYRSTTFLRQLVCNMELEFDCAATLIEWHEDNIFLPLNSPPSLLAGLFLPLHQVHLLLSTVLAMD